MDIAVKYFHNRDKNKNLPHSCPYRTNNCFLPSRFQRLDCSLDRSNPSGIKGQKTFLRTQNNRLPGPGPWRSQVESAFMTNRWSSMRLGPGPVTVTVTRPLALSQPGAMARGLSATGPDPAALTGREPGPVSLGPGGLQPTVPVLCDLKVDLFYCASGPNPGGRDSLSRPADSAEPLPGRGRLGTRPAPLPQARSALGNHYVSSSLSHAGESSPGESYGPASESRSPSL
jgi:hypothetical protein